MTPPIGRSIPRRMHQDSAAQLDASSLRIGIAVSRYHRDITDALLAGAEKAFREAKGKKANLQVIDSPGSWELTAICGAMARATKDDDDPQFNAIIALGCILTGETTHDQYISQSVTQGLTAITVATGVPIAFGVLTCQTMEQARARAGLGEAPANNKGVDAMQAAIAAAMAIRTIAQRQRSLR